MQNLNIPRFRSHRVMQQSSLFFLNLFAAQLFTPEVLLKIQVASWRFKMLLDGIYSNFRLSTSTQQSASAMTGVFILISMHSTWINISLIH
ncbi:hypothetical protein PPACK8108_LOCUS16905 [Phakopsora pachyrhizi]|uniref:Uncharacterized protein n=1 Tax=Phakopsora pachyrhizi TaxID=170000 RepID=A0AAV0BB53_PHAPC|nr:hypothetical protein PPACK8108_LOCUS16905 [Phakopsora pachyrhizi]